MKEQKGKKHKHFDRIGLWHHLLLLLLPLAVIVADFFLLPPETFSPWMLLSLVCLLYAAGYGLSHYLHQKRVKRLWDHLERVVAVNDATMELIHLSGQYQDEHAFMDALLHKAVDMIQGAEVGSILRLDPDSQRLTYESVVGMDLARLKTVNLRLEQSFEYRLTKGHCDRVVIVDDMRLFNAEGSLSPEDQQILASVTEKPLLSTLSSPIRIDGKLYAMMNLDSSQVGAFNNYDRNLVAVLTHEASSAIALYQKNREIHRLVDFDALTGLHNRKYFEQQAALIPSDAKDWFMVVLDMDNLKVLNDSHGHQTGDEALISFGQHLQQAWPKEALISRFGGDEFVLLTQSSEAELMERLERLRQEMAKMQIPVQFSIGVAPFRGDLAESFELADKRMYAQKRSRQEARGL